MGLILVLAWLFCPWWLFWPIAIIVFIIWVGYKIYKFFGGGSNSSQSTNESQNTYQSQRNISSNDIPVVCPYCKEKLYIDGKHADYECGGCGNAFIYRKNETYKNEDVCASDLLEIITLCAKVAKADGRVSEIEASEFKVLVSEWELTKNQRREAFDLFNKERSYAGDYFNSINALKEMWCGDHANAPYELVIQFMFRIALADGVFNQKEEELILKAVTAFGINQYDYKVIKKEFVSDLSECYKTLGCSTNATMAEIKIAYRELAKKFHLDTYSSQNLPKSELDEINKKFIQVREAYTKIVDSKKKG